VSDKSSSEAYYAGAYWGPRKESAEECARRAADFLNLLAPADSFLAQWYKPARRRKDARKYPLMPPDLLSLTELFRRGVNREKGGPIFEDLGFTFWFDNGGPTRDCAALRIKCGDYSGGSNYCVLTLPTYGPNADRVLTAAVLAHVVRAMVPAWEPDWAFATSYDYEDKYQEPDSAPFSLGWVTYLSHRFGRVPPLPAPVRIEPVNDKGMLIVLTPERFTITNADHVMLTRRVRELLARAGLMPSVTG